MSTRARLHEKADQKRIPFRTLSQVQEALRLAKEKGSDATLARLMLRHGRLTDAAISYIAIHYPSVRK